MPPPGANGAVQTHLGSLAIPASDASPEHLTVPSELPNAPSSVRSPIESESRAMVAEESEVFRRGLALGVDDVSDEEGDEDHHHHHHHHKSSKVTVDEGQVLKKSEVSGEELKKEVSRARPVFPSPDNTGAHRHTCGNAYTDLGDARATQPPTELQCRAGGAPSSSAAHPPPQQQFQQHRRRHLRTRYSGTLSITPALVDIHSPRGSFQPLLVHLVVTIPPSLPRRFQELSRASHREMNLASQCDVMRKRENMRYMPTSVRRVVSVCEASGCACFLRSSIRASTSRARCHSCVR